MLQQIFPSKIQPDSPLANPDCLFQALAVAIHKLGGELTITQEDFDTIWGALVLEDLNPDAWKLRVELKRKESMQ